MQIIFILFFASLAGITVMIGRKLVLLKNGAVEAKEKFSFEIPDAQEVKHIAVKNAKKYGYIALVETLRFYLRSANFLKQTSKEIKKEAKEMIDKYLPAKETEMSGKEVSKFLKTVSDYKQKIQKIKHKIKEEEGIQ